MFRRNIYAEDSAVCETGLARVMARPQRTRANMYYDKMMFLFEQLARSERVDSNVAHTKEYVRDRTDAVNLYLEGKDPDPRLDTYNMQFPLSYTIEDEMYGCASCNIDAPPELTGLMADPYATPTGMVIPAEPVAWDAPGPIGYDI